MTKTFYSNTYNYENCDDTKMNEMIKKMQMTIIAVMTIVLMILVTTTIMVLMSLTGIVILMMTPVEIATKTKR